MAGKPEFALGRLLHRLRDAEVNFVVVGGVAVVIQGSPRFTRDLDITYATDPENLSRLGGLLTALGAQLRSVEEDLPFVPDARSLEQAEMLTLTVGDGDIDLLADPPGSPGYASLKRKADRVELDGGVVLVASIDDLIAMKTASARPQDVVDLESLEIARRRRRNQQHSARKP